LSAKQPLSIPAQVVRYSHHHRSNQHSIHELGAANRRADQQAKPWVGFDFVVILFSLCKSPELAAKIARFRSL